jgi:hypothetical protein
MRRFVLIFGLFAGIVSADVIDSSTVLFTLTTGGGSAPTGSTNGTVTGFNPALGTLTDVTVFFTDVQINMDLTASLVSQSAASISGEFFDDPRAIFAGIGEIQPFNLGFAQTFGCTGAGTEVVTCSATQDFVSSPQNNMPGNDLTPNTDLAAYIGATAPFEVIDNGVATGITNVMTTGTPTGSTLTFDGTEITGDIMFQYTFTDASAPEPGSIALLGTGLVLLGSIRYRKAFQTRTMAPHKNPRSA